MVKLLLKCVIYFSLSLCWYASPNFGTKVSCPLAYCMYSSPKKLVQPLHITLRLFCQGDAVTSKEGRESAVGTQLTGGAGAAAADWRGAGDV